MKRSGLFMVSVAAILILLSFVFHGSVFADQPGSVGSIHHAPSAGVLYYVCNYNDATCSGKSPWLTIGPNKKLCGEDEYAWEQVKVPGGTVFEMGSANCGTNWAQTYQDYGQANIANANITRSSDNLHEDAVGYSTVIESSMVFSPTTPVRACGSVNNRPGGCAPWF